MSEEELALQRGVFGVLGSGERSCSERIGLALVWDEQRRLGTTIVEQPPARRIQTVGARDAKHVCVRRYLFLYGVIQESEARVVIEGQDGTSKLGAPGLRAMAHVGKVMANPREWAD